jgi:HK97 family phage major capsid protein
MKFEVKSNEELEKMTASELAGYTSAKLSFEKKEMEEKLKALEAKGDEASVEIKKIKEDQIEMLKSALKEQGIVIEKIRKGEVSNGQFMAAEDAVVKALKDHADYFKNAKTSKEELRFELDIKAVGDMTFANNLSGGNMPQAQRLDGVNSIVERVAKIYPLVPKISTSANTIDWVYETLQEGAAGGTAEGVLKNQLDNNFVVTSVSLLKQTAYFKVSTEMLQDVSFMATWLRNKLITRLFNVIDSQVLLGDGTGTNLNGVFTQATAFAAGSFALTVDNANNADSLVVAANQIRLANHDGALTIIMHPTDVTKLKLVKLSTSDKRYVDRLLQVGSTMMLDGMPIVETTAMTAGSFLIGDFSKAIIAEKGAIAVEVGLDSGDFLKNMRSILAEWRGEVIVQNNDTTAFVKGVFATTNTALETT